MRVLVAEDEPFIRRFVAEVLQAVGVEVVESSNGLEAVELLSTQEFDLVISDNTMPGLTGLELLVWMASDRRSESFVLMTGDPDPQTVRVCGELGAKVLSKPFAIADLRSLVTAG